MDKASGSYVSWDNTICNPLASPRQQALSAWEDGYASAKQEWQGLTDDELKPVIQKAMLYYGHNPDNWGLSAGAGFCILARAIEAKLREKNNG